MTRGRIALCLLLAVFVGVSLSAAPALAQEEDGESEGGIEGTIEGFVDEQGLVGAMLVIAGGAALLAVCVERLISYLTRAALNLRISLFALAILFTGFEFDDAVLALVLSAGDLEQIALGTAIGTGLAIVGVTLAVAAIARPFPVDLPTDYVVLFAVSPFLLVPFAVHRTLTFVHGVLLLGAFVLLFGYLLGREYQRDTPVFRNSPLGEEVRLDGGVTRPGSVPEIPEDRFVEGGSATGRIWLLLAVVALLGIVFGSMLLEAGSEAAVDGLAVSETVFGATFLTAILTFEDVMLTIEPVRRGVPEIGVGNVIGSVLFSVTGNVGVIMLFGDVAVSRSVVTFHLPAILLVTVLAAYFLHRGQLKRWHGYLLGGLYVAYWAIALFVFGCVPVGG